MVHSLHARNFTHHVSDLFSIYQTSLSWRVAQRHDLNLSRAVLIAASAAGDTPEWVSRILTCMYRPIVSALA
jgi:hypothetical protein